MASPQTRNKIDLAQKVLAAYGGQEKLSQIQDITGKFKFTFYQRDGTEMSGQGTEYFKPPNKNLFEFVFPTLVMLNACDGEKAWQCQDEEKPTPIDLERFIVHTRVRRFPLFLVQDPPAWNYKGEVDIENHSGVHWIEIKYSEKEKVSLYLDPKTFLLLRYQGPSRAMGMKVTTVIDFEDYKSFDGVMFASHQTFLIHVTKFQERWYDSFILNSHLPDKIFQIPG